MRKIKAIPTKYNGVEFRSRLEARWAVWFDRMGIAWQYEPEGFNVCGEAYLPDFRLPDVFGGVYVEIKPKELKGAEMDRAMRFVREFDGELLLICGLPKFGDYSCVSSNEDYDKIVFADCRKCGGVSYIGLDCKCWGDVCGHTCGEHERFPLEDGPRIIHAYESAMACKFGERTNRIGTRPNDGPTLTEMMQNAVWATGQK